MLKTAKNLAAIALFSGAIGAVVHPATAAPSAPDASEFQLPTDANGSQPVDPAQDQVTSVAQLSDVKPTDWAFQALQSLVERYGCIVGYPDRTFRGNRALTRYELS
jgi:hypothetical protein